MVERTVIEEIIVEGSTDENCSRSISNRKLLIKLLEVEDLQQASYSDGWLFFHFSNSNVGFNELTKVLRNLDKEQKYIKVILIKNKFNPIKSAHFIKGNDL